MGWPRHRPASPAAWPRHRSAAPAAIWTAVLSVWVAGCGLLTGGGGADREPVPYVPNRRDYMDFRARHPGLLEPNYLPFMAHQRRDPARDGDLLFLCRWSDEDMPLRVYVKPPVIPPALQDEFRPVEPREYVQAVQRALRTWEGELEGVVRFETVGDPEEARLTLHLRGEQAPVPHAEVQVLGSVPGLRRACRVGDGPPDADPLPARLVVERLDLYLADDRRGLLRPHAVERVALHELGHALGMHGHSGQPTDLMYERFLDYSFQNRLSQDDVNSFLSLYRLPNGTRYAFAPRSGPPPPPEPLPPTPRPVFDPAPHVDARHGFELQIPAGWMRITGEAGVFAANGPIWDRDASFEIRIWPYPDTDSLLRRFGRLLFEGTWFIQSAPWAVAGRPAWSVRVLDADRTREQEFAFVELGDERVLMWLSDCPAEHADAWRPWFRDILARIEVWETGGG